MPYLLRLKGPQEEQNDLKEKTSKKVQAFLSFFYFMKPHGDRSLMVSKCASLGVNKWK